MNKRIRHLSAFIIAILSCHVSFAALEQAADGYYIIKSAADLVEYRDAVNGGTAMDGRLASDIDMSSVCGTINGKKVTWVPINRKRLSIKCISDTYEGNGGDFNQNVTRSAKRAFAVLRELIRAL